MTILYSFNSDLPPLFENSTKKTINKAFSGSLRPLFTDKNLESGKSMKCGRVYALGIPHVSVCHLSNQL